MLTGKSAICSLLRFGNRRTLQIFSMGVLIFRQGGKERHTRSSSKALSSILFKFRGIQYQIKSIKKFGKIPENLP
nr:hypothetical protein GZ18F2_31 [uncultured archaeon GZfos18F2]